jgi:hypothetical protein
MNNIGVLQALVFEPRKAFVELDGKPRYWWPLLLVAFASAAMTFWYLSIVDFAWVTDQQIRNSSFTQNMTDAEIDRMVDAAVERRGLQKVLGTAGTFVVVPLLLFITALYYLLAGKITGVQRSLRHWMSLSAWSAMPTLLAVILGCVMLATTTTTQIGQEALQPLSLNALIFHRNAGDPGYTLLSSLNLLQLVSLWIAAFGVKVWSGRSWLFSIIFTALPLVLIFGIWAFFSLR